MNEKVQLRGSGLYVEMVGPLDAPPLLYLHGGLGGAGSYDFVHDQGERLSQGVWLIAPDRRGVLRSDPLCPGEQVTVQGLLQDMEDLRVHLGLDRWSVLGHAFGGWLAALYAITYPERVECLLLECPTFDLGLTARSLLQGAALELELMGRRSQAAKCRKLIGETDPAKLWKGCQQALRALGKRAHSLYLHHPDKHHYHRLRAESFLSPELWERGLEVEAQLLAEGRVFQSLLPQLPKLVQPTLLLCGAHDRVFGGEQLEAFQAAVPHAQVACFADSSHVPRFEEPERFAATVIGFLQAQRPRPR
ncbi:proline iminopeptidase [Tumebacillus sp. BK434]|uniref:alpha/beta fold hydrolase n=1 Tax=Tumebacillus sp. BK434 TaxID=2512169 RepID=UPI00105288FE|nr:alpha/beta hydrolase [Tumebacillus sp. BK434]TCP54742.1 proline iminopeptidase [Tumebacillus sp. BK434]